MEIGGSEKSDGGDAWELANESGHLGGVLEFVSSGGDNDS